MTPMLTNTITVMSLKITIGYEDSNRKQELSKQYVHFTLTAVATIHIEKGV